MKHLVLFSFILVSMMAVGQNGQFVETNGVKIYYEVHGEGDPLVLLHGLTMTHEMWSAWINELSEGYKVISIDMRGHGRSTNPKGEFTHKQSASDIYGLLDHLRIDEFNAMGWSSGAMTLMHMVTSDPSRFQSLVLIGSAPYFTQPTREFLARINYDYVSQNKPDWMEYMKILQPGGDAQIINLLGYYGQMAETYTDMNFTKPYLSTITCPTLIIHGDRDAVVTPDMALALNDAISDSYLWIIPNFQHTVPQNGTALGALFIETITDFMKGSWTH